MSRRHTHRPSPCASARLPPRHGRYLLFFCMMLLAAAVVRSPFLTSYITTYFGFLNYYIGSGSLLIICGTFSLGLYSTWGQVRCAPLLKRACSPPLTAAAPKRPVAIGGRGRRDSVGRDRDPRAFCSAQSEPGHSWPLRPPCIMSWHHCTDNNWRLRARRPLSGYICAPWCFARQHVRSFRRMSDRENEAGQCTHARARSCRRVWVGVLGPRSVGLLFIASFPWSRSLLRLW